MAGPYNHEPPKLGSHVRPFDTPQEQLPPRKDLETYMLQAFAPVGSSQPGVEQLTVEYRLWQQEQARDFAEGRIKPGDEVSYAEARARMQDHHKAVFNELWGLQITAEHLLAHYDPNRQSTLRLTVDRLNDAFDKIDEGADPLTHVRRIRHIVSDFIHWGSPWTSSATGEFFPGIRANRVKQIMLCAFVGRMYFTATNGFFADEQNQKMLLEEMATGFSVTGNASRILMELLATGLSARRALESAGEPLS